MIRFSRKEDYAVILVHELVENYKKRLVPLSEIAKEYNISLLFLRNLANELKHAGLIKAVEGKSGGYYIDKDPTFVKVGEVLQIFSKESLVRCCSALEKKSTKTACSKESFCQPGYIWRKLNKEFLEKIYNLTLKEFMEYRSPH